MAIIDEEIRQKIIDKDTKFREEGRNIDTESDFKIYMFNVHDSKIIYPIYKKRRPIIMQQLIEEGEIEDPNKKVEEKAEDVKPEDPAV